jgi:hypothetical protein
MYVKIHESASGKILAACDEDLLGKSFSEGERYLDLEKYRGFYADRKVSEGELMKELKGRFISANLVGESSVKAAIKAKLLSKKDVMRIQGVPYAHIYYL